MKVNVVLGPSNFVFGWEYEYETILRNISIKRINMNITFVLLV